MQFENRKKASSQRSVIAKKRQFLIVQQMISI